MKYKRSQFTTEYYQLWEVGLCLPVPQSASVYSVKYRKNHFDEYSRVTLKAVSVSDALERACYAITYASPWRPEDIDLHAVYDVEENLLWLDETFYALVQKKHEFRGMERREFLAKFGMTGAAILFGLRVHRAEAATATVTLGGSASGFPIPTGEQLYTTAGSFSWTAPTGVSLCSVVCVGAGGMGGYANPIGGGGGGALSYANSLSVIPGNSYSVTVGAVASYGTANTSGSSSFSTYCLAGGGASGAGTASGGVVGTGSGGAGGAGGSGGAGMQGAGGGGAGGYTGVGGAGTIGDTAATAGSGGGGGGGVGGTFGNGGGMGGGGVGLFGLGANGAGGSGSTYATHCGKGGSGGADANSSSGAGGNYGGGYGAGHGGTVDGTGAVRIIWGTGRSFPSSAS